MQIRCPHCHNPIDVVNDDPSGDVSCPSCGSCFNLAKDIETAQDDGSHAKMLGHFQLLNCLGQGAFGAVWKARDTKLDRIVALKIPRKEQLTEADAEKFLREARAAAQVRHPNIVSVHEVGREDGRIYIASDFIDGPSLDQWIEAHPLTVRESVELCAQIAEALHHAHEAGIVHRDLKPQNILVKAEGLESKGLGVGGQGLAKARDTQAASGLSSPTPNPQSLTPYLTDFGLAKREAGEITMTVEGAILGTPAYMSPEQARGEAHHADRRSDIYSLGVILFRLVTGELPFRGKSQMLLQQILNEEPPPLRKLDARIPRDVETICAKCLEKDPARRYPSAAELSAELRRWLTGHPILARPVSRVEHAWRWCRRNPAIASLSTTVALVLLIGMAVSWFFASQSSQRANALANKQGELVKKQGELIEETKRANRKADEADENAQTATAKAEEAKLSADLAERRRRAAADNLTLANRHLYAADMTLAQQYWESAHIGLLLQRLDRHRPKSDEPDLRGFEWHYWDRLCHSALLDLKGHTFGVNSVAFSADGKRLASASDDGTVKVWDANSGKMLLTLKGHTGGVTSVAFSADGKRLASGSHGGFSTGTPGDVKVWDATNGEDTLTLKGHTDWVNSVAFSADGKRLASASSDQTVKVWDATSGQEMLTLKGHTDWVNSVAYSADGQRLVSAGGNYDKTVKVWDATSGQEMLTLKGHTGYVMSVAFSADGKRLVSASADQTVKVWDTTSGQEMLTLKGHTDGSVTSVAFSPDGKRLASASEDRTVKVWDTKSSQETGTLKAAIEFYAHFDLLDVFKGQETLTLKGHTGTVQSVAFSPDGKRLASASQDQTVKVWDATSGQEMLTLRGHTGEVTSVVFSADGQRLASASYDGTVKVWDATIGQPLLTLKGHISSVNSVAFSADEKRLASASSDGTVKIWDARPWTLELRAEREALSVIRWLQGQDKPQAEWLDAIAADQTLSEPVRQRALQFAREWK